MQVNVPIQIPDPRFAQNSLIATPEGHVFHVFNVEASVPAHMAFGAAAAGYGGVQSGRSATWQHLYTLVVQRSNLLRPGQVVLEVESPTARIGAQQLKAYNGGIVPPDNVGNVRERTLQSAG